MKQNYKSIITINGLIWELCWLVLGNKRFITKLLYLEQTVPLQIIIVYLCDSVLFVHLFCLVSFAVKKKALTTHAS
jgi:hypothetical protein